MPWHGSSAVTSWSTKQASFGCRQAATEASGTSYTRIISIRTGYLSRPAAALTNSSLCSDSASPPWHRRSVTQLPTRSEELNDMAMAVRLARAAIDEVNADCPPWCNPIGRSRSQITSRPRQSRKMPVEEDRLNKAPRLAMHERHTAERERKGKSADQWMIRSWRTKCLFPSFCAKTGCWLDPLLPGACVL